MKLKDNPDIHKCITVKCPRCKRKVKTCVKGLHSTECPKGHLLLINNETGNMSVRHIIVREE